MAHRDTDTEKWDDVWFQGLSLQSKLFWQYICDKCDHAGVWKENRPLAEFQIGSRIDWDEVKGDLDGRINIMGDRWVILGFIQFHYGTLSTHHKMYPRIQSALSCHKMKYCIDTLSIVYLNDGNRLSEVADSLKDKDKDKDSSLSCLGIGVGGEGENSIGVAPILGEKKKPEYDPDFIAFWELYPRRVAKGAAYKSWLVNIKKNAVPSNTVMKALEWQRKSEQWTKDNGRFVPYPATWLNQGRFYDEPQEILTPAYKPPVFLGA